MINLESDSLIDTRSAAQLLAMSEDTLKAWRTRKVGPPYRKINGAVRYVRSELEAYLEEVRVNPSNKED